MAYARRLRFGLTRRPQSIRNRFPEPTQAAEHVRIGSVLSPAQKLNMSSEQPNCMSLRSVSKSRNAMGCILCKLSCNPCH